MARADKSVAIYKVVDITERGLFREYSKAAVKYRYNLTGVSKRIRLLTKTWRDADSFQVMSY